MNDGDDFKPDNSGCFNLAIVLMIIGVLGFFLTGVIGGTLLLP
jgi:hypothetical protein